MLEHVLTSSDAIDKIALVNRKLADQYPFGDKLSNIIGRESSLVTKIVKSD